MNEFAAFPIEICHSLTSKDFGYHQISMTSMHLQCNTHVIEVEK